ncbi:hypothetical protein ABFV99_13340 [Cytobacillus horneckiae]|uniref:hypothetical protein n=1 Tax=Cytobacillus horneckiae TaxID=549687 RepID=UPI0034CEF81F
MISIAKSELTTQLEREIYYATKKTGVFGCFEVTIGWYGRERVDYMTFDTKGAWRCYEIKVSLSDFRSKAKKTFVGHFNYYVLTNELYEKVKDEIPDHIGVYVGGSCVKKAKKQKLAVGDQILKDSMIRSLARESDKLFESGSPASVSTLRRQVMQARKERDQYKQMYRELMNHGRAKYGNRWHVS